MGKAQDRTFRYQLPTQSNNDTFSIYRYIAIDLWTEESRCWLLYYGTDVGNPIDSRARSYANALRSDRNRRYSPDRMFAVGLSINNPSC